MVEVRDGPLLQTPGYALTSTLRAA
jgi:hypothetical protein